MERLTQSPKLEIILSAQSPDEVCRAAEDFRTEILAMSKTEISLTATYRTLRYTACHLLALNRTCRKGSMAEKLKELSDIVAIELELLDMRIKGLLPTANTVLASPAKKFRWTGKVVDLVELLYALDTCDCIDNGEIGVEELADAFSDIFGVEIKNCYNVYMNMKRRKDDSRTYFLDELREKLNKRMVESDLKGGKFKKR